METPRKRRDSLAGSSLRSTPRGTPFSKKNTPEVSISTWTEEYDSPPKFSLGPLPKSQLKPSLTVREEAIAESDDPFEAPAFEAPPRPTRSATEKIREAVRPIVTRTNTAKERQDQANQRWRAGSIAWEEDFVPQRLTRRATDKFKEVVSIHGITRRATDTIVDALPSITSRKAPKVKYEFERILPLDIHHRGRPWQGICLASAKYNSWDGSYDQCRRKISRSRADVALHLDAIRTFDSPGAIEKISSFLAQGSSIPFCKHHRDAANKHLDWLRATPCDIEGDEGSEPQENLQDRKKTTYFTWISALGTLDSESESASSITSSDEEVDVDDVDDVEDLHKVRTRRITSTLHNSLRTGKKIGKRVLSITRFNFGTKPLDFEEILPSDLQQRGAEGSGKCLASCTTKKRGQQCSKPIAAYRQAVTAAHLETISDLSSRGGIKEISDRLGEALPFTMCWMHQRIADSHLTTIQRLIDDNEDAEECQLDVEDVTGKTFLTWIESFRKAPSPKKSKAPNMSSQRKKLGEQSISVSVSAESSLPRFQRPSTDAIQFLSKTDSGLSDRTTRYLTKTNASARRKSTGHGHTQMLIPYQPKTFHGHKIFTSLSDALYQAMTIPLGKRELEKTGWIYMYRIRLHRDAIKIGWTATGIEKRVKEWARKCKHDAEILYHKVLEKLGPVQFVPRLEVLVHTQLRQWRHKFEGCQGCGKVHIEWFLLKKGFALRAIEKWAAWMAEKPYEIVVRSNGDRTGRLREGLDRSKLWKLCEELEEAVVEYPVEPLVARIPTAG